MKTLFFFEICCTVYCDMIISKTVELRTNADGGRDDQMSRVTINGTLDVEYGRCKDKTCEKFDRHKVLDISTYSEEDELVWFKVINHLN